MRAADDRILRRPPASRRVIVTVAGGQPAYLVIEASRFAVTGIPIGLFVGVAATVKFYS